MNDFINPITPEEVIKSFQHIRPIAYKHTAIDVIHDLINHKKVTDKDLFIIEGLWAYEKILKSNVIVKTFVFCPDFIKSDAMLHIVKSLLPMAEEAYTISSKVCERLSSRDGAEGFFMVCKLPSCDLNEIALKDNNVIVILDGLEKPENIGSIIRSVDGAGGDAVILCNRKVRRTHPKLIKSSMGSGFIMPVIEADMDALSNWLQVNHFKIIVTDLKATETYYSADYSGRVAIVAGNEIHGISKDWDTLQCMRVIIPMLGGADSLNVGFATTLVAYEASLRQRGMLNRSLPNIQND